MNQLFILGLEFHAELITYPLELRLREKIDVCTLARRISLFCGNFLARKLQKIPTWTFRHALDQDRGVLNEYITFSSHEEVRKCRRITSPLNFPRLFGTSTTTRSTCSHILNQSTEILEPWRPLYSPPLSPLLLPSLRWGVKWCQEFHSDGHFLAEGRRYLSSGGASICDGLCCQEHSGRSQLLQKEFEATMTPTISAI